MKRSLGIEVRHVEVAIFYHRALLLNVLYGLLPEDLLFLADFS